MTKQTLQIIWHSRTGASQQLASAAQRGAQDALTALEVTETHQVRSTVATAVSLKQFYPPKTFFFSPQKILAICSAKRNAFCDRTITPTLNNHTGHPSTTIRTAAEDG